MTDTDLSPADRGRLLLSRLGAAYDLNPGDDWAREVMLQEVLADIRHACDVLALEYGKVDRAAHYQYQAEIAPAR